MHWTHSPSYSSPSSVSKQVPGCISTSKYTIFACMSTADQGGEKIPQVNHLIAVQFPSRNTPRRHDLRKGGGRRGGAQTTGFVASILPGNDLDSDPFLFIRGHLGGLHILVAGLHHFVLGWQIHPLWGCRVKAHHHHDHQHTTERQPPTHHRES